MNQGMTAKDTGPWLTAQSFEGLAQEVISLLNCNAEKTQHVRIRALDKLISQILTRGLFDPTRVASMLRGQYLSDVEVVELYIPEAARRLGLMWAEDVIGFAEVSIGTARLQSLTHAVSADWADQIIGIRPKTVRLIAVTMEGEDHTLGAVTLAPLLRRGGHDVELMFNARAGDLIRNLTYGRHDGVLLSCSRPEGLASLTRVIQEIRSRMDRAPVLAIGGVVLDFTPDIQQITGADLVTRDINQVVKLALSFRRARINVVR